MTDQNTNTALFVNFTEEPFTGYWNGKPNVFAPGERRYMPEYLAKHFAKHLTNRELLKVGKETMTSPKRPQDVPDFMAIFNKCCIVQETERPQTETEMQIDIANKTAAAEPPVSVGAEVRDDEKFEKIDKI